MSTEPLAQPPRSQPSSETDWGWVPVGLSFCIILIDILTGWAVAMKYLREDGILTGAVIAMNATMMGFWFGTTKSSERNGAAVRQQLAASSSPSLSTSVTDSGVETKVTPQGGTSA